MGFLADLRTDTYGLQFIPPSSWQLEVDRDSFASFQDETYEVDWYVEFLPQIVDLSLEHRGGPASLDRIFQFSSGTWRCAPTQPWAV